MGQPLTDAPWEVVVHRGRSIRVETNAEIVAKKMYRRGNQAKARDLFAESVVDAASGRGT